MEVKDAESVVCPYQSGFSTLCCGTRNLQIFVTLQQLSFLSFSCSMPVIGPVNFCFIFHSKAHVDGSAAILTVLVTEAEGQRDPEGLSQANKEYR